MVFGDETGRLPKDGTARLSFTWLPCWEWILKPKRPMIEMTSAPDKRRSLGMCRDQFQCDEDRRVRNQTHRRQILAG